MSHASNERMFFWKNDGEVNRLVFQIGWIFMAVLAGILVAAYTDLFKVSPKDVLLLMGLLLVTELVFAVLLKCEAPTAAIKYYGLIALECCLVLMVSNAYFGVYICYILVPAISCLYFDQKLTGYATAFGYLGMLVGLWLRAPGAIVLAYPGYTRLGWFIAFGLGYTLEYIALSAVLIAVSRRAKRYMKELYHRSERITEIQNTMIYRFADLVEMRDDSTGKHIKRTSKYVAMIANHLRQAGPYAKQIGDEDAVNMELAAPLHDIGKITIPDTILKKPGKLTKEEFEIIQTHAVEGRRIIDASMEGIEGEAFIAVAKDIALSHHEKWDGSGYPNGLAGEAISLPARIMAVADVFDALVSTRCYKQAISVEEAFGILSKGKGKHFDPYLVDVFIAASDEVHQILHEQ